MKVLPQHFSPNSHSVISSAAIAHHFKGRLSNSYEYRELMPSFIDGLRIFFDVKTEYETREYSRTLEFGRLQYSYLYIPKHECIISCNTSQTLYPSATVYYQNREKVIPIIDFLNSHIPPKPPAENYISLITQKGNELDTKSFKIKIGEVNVALNYGKEFLPKYEKIIGTLAQPDGKGIVLLHGIPGTGKTSLIKYIAKNLIKTVLFVPPAMAGALCSPEFLTFMMGFPNSILIIEDAEKVVSNRDSAGSSQSGVSNILNISDGILGDCLNIQIIASFNTKRDNTDEALLRKGRLIAEHEFGPLSIDDSQLLLDKLDKDHIAQQPMTLTEIYNIDEIEYKSTIPRKTIGFVTA